MDLELELKPADKSFWRSLFLTTGTLVISVLPSLFPQRQLVVDLGEETPAVSTLSVHGPQLHVPPPPSNLEDGGDEARAFNLHGVGPPRLPNRSKALCLNGCRFHQRRVPGLGMTGMQAAGASSHIWTSTWHHLRSRTPRDDLLAFSLLTFDEQAIPI
jgi:hypothetical protein